MYDYYDEIFDAYKEYISDNYKTQNLFYDITFSDIKLLSYPEQMARVVKYFTRQSTYFPLITCESSDNTDGVRTQRNVDNDNNYYFTINIYTKDSGKTSAYVIDKELEKLTIKFFGEILGFVKTKDNPEPNLDTNILRRIIYYQGKIDNRGNITRI